MAFTIGHVFCYAETEQDTIMVTPTAFETVIQQLGLTTITNEYSESKKIIIAEPSCAYINITGTDKMPGGKSQKQHVWLDVYTGYGCHFRKRAIISAQGNSSLMFPKKNFKADFCEDEWLGNETTSITIGDWVKQDAFHFKAYYIDYLRGVGVVGLQLYDQIARNSGRPWTRGVAHIAKPKEGARCYPDGFPCIVYLNGDFYGIFSWQLKKHRDNMNQTKNVAEHIHLDGNIGYDNFWDVDSIAWTMFEVRNPKNLFTMGGAVYDGDNPQELMDETSVFYDVEGDDVSTRENKQRTAKVKHYIEALSRLHSQLKELQASGTNAIAMRSFIEEHFDMPSLIDYVCFHLAVNNYDGFRKNWQWFTYDGKKWFVAPYDLDCIMGNSFKGNYIIPADRTWIGGGAPWAGVLSFAPISWLGLYFADEIAHRYKELRDADIIDTKNVKWMLHDWYNRVGQFNYDAEWLQWPESMCISETVTNEGWTQCDSGYGLPAYNDTVVYQPGDRCTLGDLVWEATGTICGVRPYVQLGYHDSLERFEAWLDERIHILDAHFEYSSIPTGVSKHEHTSSSPVVYSLSGQRILAPRKGINIIGGRKVVK